MTHWYAKTLRTHANKVRAKRMTPRVQGLLDDWSKHPLGTADADKMQQACEVRMTHHQELFNFYAVKSDARLKFLTAQRDQRMMDQEVNRILKLDRPIAFGDGSDGFSPNGKPGGPVKRFMRLSLIHI